MVGVDTLVEHVSRWYLLNAPSAPLGDTIEEVRPLFAELAGLIEQVGSESWRRDREEMVAYLTSHGVEEELARRHAFQPELVHAPDIVAVAKSTGRTIEDVANGFFLAGERLHLDWFERRLVELPETSRFERWAVHAMGDDLMAIRRDIALRALQGADTRPVGAAIDDYLAGRAEAVERLEKLVDSLAEKGESSLAALTVALRQVRGLVS